MKRLIPILLAALLLGACDDGPTEPSQNLSGNWTGTWTFVTAGVTVTDAVTTTLGQSTSSLTGPWSAASGTTGQFTLSVNGSNVTGSTTISQTLVSGQVCSGSTSMTGTANPNRLELTLAALTSTGVCQWATGQQFVFTR